MFAEVKNSHSKYQEFIDYIRSHVSNASIRDYESSTYVDTHGVRIINFFSSIFHDAVMTDKDEKGELIQFPLDLFGTIYEL